MNRQDVIRTVLEHASGETIIVSSIADESFELFLLGDRPRNFYMLGSFGMAPSIGLGLALARRERVIVIDGDGSLLYNLGSLATEGRYGPENLLHLVVDNGAHGATGYQPTATSSTTRLDAVAEGCGISSISVDDAASLLAALGRSLEPGGPRLIVARVGERPPVQAPLPDLGPVEIRDRFLAALGTSKP